MKNFPEYFKTTAEYTNTIDPIKDFPDYQRVPAENRFISIKEYEYFLKNESSRLGRKFRKTQALNEFCIEKKISQATFYEYLRSYGRHGISGLLTAYGNRKGESRYAKSIMPIIWEVIEPGKGYAHSYKKLATACIRKGISAPSYDTFLRLCNANGLSDSLRRPKPIRIKRTAIRKNEPKKNQSKERLKNIKLPYEKFL